MDASQWPATEEARVLEWVLAGEATESAEEENALQWLSNIGSGAASGATTGAIAGPWGALVGALLGGGLGAVQTGLQQSRPAPPPPRAAPPPASRPGAAPAPQAVQPRPTAPSAPASGGGDAAAVVQQVAQLLPLLTQLLAGQRSGESAEAVAARVDDDVRGDPVPDAAFMAAVAAVDPGVVDGPTAVEGIAQEDERPDEAADLVTADEIPEEAITEDVTPAWLLPLTAPSPFELVVEWSSESAEAELLEPAFVWQA